MRVLPTQTQEIDKAAMNRFTEALGRHPTGTRRPLLFSPKKIYLGIDPGVSGGMAVISGGVVRSLKMPTSHTDVWEWMSNVDLSSDPAGLPADVFAVIEQQIPRPTSFFDKGIGKFRSSILKSTCLLYGDYQLLRGMLIGASIPFEECPPKRWQQGLKIPPRAKSENDTQWKNRLKAKAQSLFPKEKITLATADALLICEYCRRWREGKL